MLRDELHRLVHQTSLFVQMDTLDLTTTYPSCIRGGCDRYYECSRYNLSEMIVARRSTTATIAMVLVLTKYGTIVDTQLLGTGKKL